MSTKLLDVTILHVDDHIRIYDRADALGNDQTGSILHFGLQCLAKFPVCLIVQSGEGIIEDIYLRVAGNGTGDGETLLLIAGEVDAVPGNSAEGAALLLADKGAICRRSGLRTCPSFSPA